MCQWTSGQNWDGQCLWENCLENRAILRQCQKASQGEWAISCLSAKGLAKLANTAWQTPLLVSESLAMDKKVMPDLRGNWQQCLAISVGQFCQALTMMFSCKNLALNMTKPFILILLFNFPVLLSQIYKRLLWKGWSLQKFWLEFLLCI